MTVPRRIYDVTISCDGGWWLVHVPAIDGLTQASHLGDVEQMARELVAITLDVPLDSFDVNVEVQ